MVDRIARAGHKIKLLLRALGDHVRNIVVNGAVAFLCDLYHTLGEIHAGRFDPVLREQFAQDTCTAGEIHRGLHTDIFLIKPLQQCFAENFRIVIPAKFVIYLTEDITIHNFCAVSFLVVCELF